MSRAGEFTRVHLLCILAAAVVVIITVGAVQGRNAARQELAAARAEVAAARTLVEAGKPTEKVHLSRDLWVITDPETGCQYLRPDGYGGLTPRLPDPCPRPMRKPAGGSL